MSTEYLELGPTPAEESCFQVGQENFWEMGRKECLVYKHMLQRMFPDCQFRIKSFPHDFGTYFEVCVVYDATNDSEVDKAYEVENRLPSKWDDMAKKELGEFVYIGEYAHLMVDYNLV